MLYFCEASNNNTSPLKFVVEEANQLVDIFNGINESGSRAKFTRKTTQRIVQDLVGYKKDITIFHFAGHSNETALGLINGNVANINIKYLLSECQDLKLVFLNSCNSDSLGNDLKENGIPIVIAFKGNPGDILCNEFSVKFYSLLFTGYNIADSFNMASMHADPSKPYPKGSKLNGSVGRSYMAKEFNDAGAFHPVLLLKEDGFKQKKISDLIEVESRQIDEKYLSSFVRPGNWQIDRKRLIETIHQKAQIRNGSVLWVWGLAGEGKTSSIARYVERFEEYYDHIVWIDLKREYSNVSSFKKQLFYATQKDLKLKKNLNLSGNAERTNKAFSLSLSSIGGENLLVLDHFESDYSGEIVKMGIPENWKIIIISESSSESFFDDFHHSQLSTEEAITLFKKLTNKDDINDDDIIELVSLVNCHVLTVELLGRASHNPILTAKFLSQSIKQRRFANRVKSSKVFSGITPSRALVFEHILSILDSSKLHQEEYHYTRQVAIWFSLLPNSLPLERLINLFIRNTAVSDNEEIVILGESLKYLESLGWIKNEGNSQNVYSMHPVVKEALRERFSPDDSNSSVLIEVVLNELEQLNKALPKDWDRSSDQTINIAQSIFWGLTSMKPQTYRKFRVLSTILGNTSFYLEGAEIMKEISTKLLEINPQLKNPKEYWKMKADIATKLMHSGKYKESLLVIDEINTKLSRANNTLDADLLEFSIALKLLKAENLIEDFNNEIYDLKEGYEILKTIDNEHGHYLGSRLNSPNLHYFHILYIEAITKVLLQKENPNWKELEKVSNNIYYLYLNSQLPKIRKSDILTAISHRQAHSYYQIGKTEKSQEERRKYLKLAKHKSEDSKEHLRNIHHEGSMQFEAYHNLQAYIEFEMGEYKAAKKTWKKNLTILENQPNKPLVKIERTRSCILKCNEKLFL